MFSDNCNLRFPSCLSIEKDNGSDELLGIHNGNREPVILNVYDMVSTFNFIPILILFTNKKMGKN